MSITLTPFAHGELCHGCTWTIDDEDQLARQIALVAVGQSRHVERILAGAHLGPPPAAQSVAAGAIAILTVANPAQPYHRDGWMFQVMSWIAAHTATPGGIIRAPQMILAHKGFDGLRLELDANNQSVTAAILFEDKATENPRNIIRDEVWPELLEFESGKSDNVLLAEVIGLLQSHPGLDPDQALQKVIWKEVRRYRVSITVGEAHGNDAGRMLLFAGYDTTAVGAVIRRRGETVLIAALRDWMTNLAAKAIAEINAMEEANV